MTIGNAGVAVRLEKETSAPPQLQTFLSRYFYFSMSLVMAGLVVWGFSKTVDTNLFHANPPRLGFTIAVIMARFDTVVLHQSGADAFLSIPFWDLGRFDFWFNHSIFYVGLDVLILLGVVRDLVVDGRVHKVYRYVLPALIVGQSLAVYAWRVNPAWWRGITKAILG